MLIKIKYPNWFPLCKPKMNYLWHDRSQKIIMTEAMSMKNYHDWGNVHGFNSLPTEVFRVFLITINNKNETKWLKQVPQFACYWLQPWMSERKVYIYLAVLFYLECENWQANSLPGQVDFLLGKLVFIVTWPRATWAQTGYLPTKSQWK